MGTINQGQGHATTYAQIVATELGIPSDEIQVEEGDTSTAPYGLGTYGSRSTPVGGAAMAHGGAQDPRQGEEDRGAPARGRRRTTSTGRSTASRSRATSRRFKTMKDIAWAAYHEPPPGLEPGLEAVHYYDPPNFTFPFGAYLCVVDIDQGHRREPKVRRFYALDDCGTRINPMIIEGQIHGGLTEGFAVAMGQKLLLRRAGQHRSATRCWTTSCRPPWKRRSGRPTSP